jgi:hypothetical protein
MSVTLMIPRTLLKEDGYLALRNVPIVAADVTGAEGEGAAINGVKEWMPAGLPSLLQASIKKVTRNKDHTELELRGNDVRGAELVVKLRFAHSLPDPQATLGELLIEGAPDTPAALKYRQEAHAAVAGAIFAGDLKDLPEERKLSILATLQRSAGAPDVHLHEGRVHASFDLGVDGTIFNDSTADEQTIVAQVLNETLLPQVRQMAKSLADVPELHGMRVLYRIPHKPKRAAATKEYRVELVADMTDVVKFAKVAVTNQEFLDASKVVVDGNSVQLTLAPPSAAAVD